MDIFQYGVFPSPLVGEGQDEGARAFMRAG